MRGLYLEESPRQLLTMKTIALCAYTVENTTMNTNEDMTATLSLIESRKVFVDQKIRQLIINANEEPEEKRKKAQLRQNQNRGVEE